MEQVFVTMVKLLETFINVLRASFKVDQSCAEGSRFLSDCDEEAMHFLW